MFLLDNIEDLSPITLGKIINTFQTRDLPRLEHYRNYYKGKMKISYKMPTDDGRSCNRTVVNFCRTCVGVFNGYITGNDITYGNDDESINIEPILDVLNYNDVHQEDTEFLRNALIYGRACELNYIDSEGQQRFALLDPRQVIDVYDNTLEHNLIYGIYFYRADFSDLIVEDQYYVDVYSDTTIRHYISSPGFASFTLVSEEPHFFQQVPMTFFKLDADEDSIFDQIMALNDAYNELLSGNVDAFNDFSDAYLVLKGVTADADDLAAMKQHRVLMIDNDADAHFLTKNVNDTQVQTTLTDIERLIHVIGNFPDFYAADFSAQSGVALKYKLIGFTNISRNIEAYMRKALQKRIELICSILNIKGEDAAWRDMNIEFNESIPEDVADTAQIINMLRGLVSDETLIGQLEFVNNPKEEAEKARQEAKAKMPSLYGDSFENSELLAGTPDAGE